MKNKMLLRLAILSLSFLGTSFAQAQDQSQAQQTQQSPASQPSVARISMIHGDVNTQRGDSGDWVAGVLNSPLVVGDRVATGTRSRLELTLDFANYLRLDERTEAKIADLTRTHIQVQIARGIVDYSVLKGNEADIEIDTPNVAIHPVREGRYRIQITSDDFCEVIVRDGELEITTPQGSTRIHKGQMITVRGLDTPEFQTADAPHNDSWDDWNKERDRQVQDAASWGHANRYYTGVNDLDAYGHWTYAPGYGDVWVPAQSAGWAPYRDGRWVWEPYWGWTWVSYEPWGWAPYHYGRWFVNEGSWCWWPGPVYAAYRPFWSPAYVSFFGFSGRHFSVGVGFGFGSIGWLPIGPGDPFFPWWGGFRRNVTVVNIININNFHGGRRWDPLWNGSGRRFSNLDGAFNDRRLRESVTTMRADEFGRGGVRRDFERVNAEQFRGGQMVAGAVPVVPTRESLRSSDRQVNRASLPTRGGQDRFFTRSTPRGSPESFQAGESQMRDVVRQNGPNASGSVRGDARMENSQGRNDAAGRGGSQAQQNAGSGAERTRGGGQQSVAPNRGGQGTPQTPDANGQQQRWQRFGDKNTAEQQGRRDAQRPGFDRPRTESQPAGRGNGQPSANPQQGGQGRGNPQPPATPRQNNQPAANPQQGGWQHFTPGQQGDRQRFGDAPRDTGRSPQFDSPRNADRSGGFNSPRSSGRQQLDLQRPIMTPRSSPPDRGNGGGRMSPPPSSSPRGGASASPRGGEGSRGGSRGGDAGRGGGGSSRSSSGSSGGRGGQSGRPH
jgi:hypothetical protein